MNDTDCVHFLQWALPHLRMRWPGFRKVRGQVCKRVQRRIDELGLPGADGYRDYLQASSDEWGVLDRACRVTISRFNRDRVVLDKVGSEVLPVLADAVLNTGKNALRAWSAGCAMGEEAYTLVLIWDQVGGRDYPRLDIHVTGSDIDELLLRRAARACYAYSSVKALPETWLKSAFGRHGDEYCLEPRLRKKAEFIRQDIRDRSTMDPFHIVFCRNLAFTYFENALQLEILDYLHGCLVHGGALVIGHHESLPAGFTGFEPWSTQKAIFRRVARANP